MFGNIHNQLYKKILEDSSFLQNAPEEIQILTGWFEKPKNTKQRIEKLKRKFKYRK